MTYKYLEPTKAPRGAELTGIEARKRIIANDRLTRFNVPKFSVNVVGHRQLVEVRKRTPLQPYTSPVSEGLLSLIDEHDNRAGGA